MSAKTEIITKDEEIHPIAVQQDQYMGLIHLAVEKNVDIVQFEKLMDLQERYEANKAKKAFNSAMSVFQSDLPIIKKKGNVHYESSKGITDYNYAKLEDIAQAIRPALKQSGLSYRFTQEQNSGQIKVTCIVTGIDGHSESSSLHSNPDISGGKDPLKALASAISYLRRYTLTGLLGIVVGGEDDEGGEGGFSEEKSQPESEKETSNTLSDELFETKFPKWEKMILNGKKTNNDVIKSVNDKGILFSEEQLTKINNVSKAL